jgi:hypothetical protein
MGILLKLGYFIANNDARNDIYIRAILRKYRRNIKDLNSRRVRYLDYIINLAVKAFLFLAVKAFLWPAKTLTFTRYQLRTSRDGLSRELSRVKTTRDSLVNRVGRSLR